MTIGSLPTRLWFVCDHCLHITCYDNAFTGSDALLRCLFGAASHFRLLRLLPVVDALTRGGRITVTWSHRASLYCVTLTCTLLACLCTIGLPTILRLRTVVASPPLRVLLPAMLRRTASYLVPSASGVINSTPTGRLFAPLPFSTDLSHISAQRNMPFIPRYV